MNTLIDNLQWRYAVKKYNPAKVVSENDLAHLKKAIQYSASSVGLQPYRVLVIADKEVKAKLAEHSFGNKDSILNASHVFVFAVLADADATDVAKYMENISAVRGIPVENLDGFRTYIEGSLSSKSVGQKQEWSARQTYLALGNLLAAAAELRIDATPMEGFAPEQYDEILGLGEKGLKSVVIATVGYRDASDAAQHLKKVRKPESELFINL